MHRVVLLAPAALLLAACGAATGAAQAGSARSADAGRLAVVTTTTQVTDFTRNVAGNRADVRGLLRPNIDPHDHEASPADVQALADADVVVENGVGLEAGWLDPALEAAGFAGTRVDASRGITVRQGNGTDEEAAGDPHVWHDPRNAKTMVEGIARALSQADPAGAATYAANAAAYSGKLDALDADLQRQVDSLPPDARKLVTDHDAFGYYVARYGFTFIGSVIPSFDTSAGLSGAQVNALVARIRQTGTRAVFSESSLPANAAETLAREAGVKVVSGEDSLYGDTLGPAGSDGATYLQMEEHNTATIVGALR